VPLPRNPNVTTILKQFSAAEKQSRPKRPGSADADIFEEVISGIKVYFDRCLGNILLYRFERQQYIDIRRANDGKEMSDIYGAEHLLRLFGILISFLQS
jgi:mortality factor 4-like protein 1